MKLKIKKGTTYRCKKTITIRIEDEIKGYINQITFVRGWDFDSPKDGYLDALGSEGPVMVDQPVFKGCFVDVCMDVKFDFKKLPSWCNHAIAMNKDGKWYAFNSNDIVAHGSGWSFVRNSEPIYKVLIPDQFAPGFTGIWENSLMLNPDLL